MQSAPNLGAILDPDTNLPEAVLFLISDPKKCTGCHSCMLMCALAHEGKAQFSTSRILISEDRFGSFPVDITIGTCRQCKDPACLSACRVGAIYIDQEHFGARVIDPELCTGCKRCVNACHFYPSRVRFQAQLKKAVKCDLCRDTPYWEHERGQLACVEVCPVNALASTTETPLGLSGYEVNLRRTGGWSKLDLPTD